LLVSILSLSIYLQPDRREIEEFVSRRVKRAVQFTILVAFFLIYQWVIGIWAIINPGHLARLLLDVGTIGIWGVLIFINGIMTFTLIENNYRPVLSRDLINIMFYFAVLYIALERFSFPWLAVGVASTVLSIVILYFLMELIKYLKILSMLVEPVSLYIPALGFRIFSGLIGLLLISFAYSEDVFKELIVLSYLFL